VRPRFDRRGHLIHTVFTDFTYGFASLGKRPDAARRPAGVVGRGPVSNAEGLQICRRDRRGGQDRGFRKKVKARLPDRGSRLI